MIAAAPMPWKRGDREEAHATDIHAPVADQFTEGRQRQQRGDHRDLVGVGDPDDGRFRRVQFARDLRQRRVADGRVERGQDHGAHQGRHGHALLEGRKGRWYGVRPGQQHGGSDRSGFPYSA
jgi:hypothetical protein